jgi:hypothetical protein
MRMRSTGLGKTELVGNITEFTRTGNYLILHLTTTDPVRWHVRSAMNIKDLYTIFRMVLRPTSLYNIVMALMTHILNRKAGPPPEF